MTAIHTIRSGWILNINGTEYTVAGSNKLRGTQYYILRSTAPDPVVRSITRADMLAGFGDGSIKYVSSIVNDVAKYRRFLVNIRDTGMSADEASEHAADALSRATP